MVVLQEQNQNFFYHYLISKVFFFVYSKPEGLFLEKKI